MSESKVVTEQQAAERSGPRVLKDEGSPEWCWQTVAALQTQWNALGIDYSLYEETWQDAEKHRIWEKVPYDAPYGSKEEMLRLLEIGDVPAAKARVEQLRMDSRPLGKQGRPSNGEKPSATNVLQYGEGAKHIYRRLERDHPDILKRFEDGEFATITEAGREAGFVKEREKSVRLNRDVRRVAANIRKHYSAEQVWALRDALREDE